MQFQTGNVNSIQLHEMRGMRFSFRKDVHVAFTNGGIRDQD